jgi:hypothetical protein
VQGKLITQMCRPAELYHRRFLELENNEGMDPVSELLEGPDFRCCRSPSKVSNGSRICFIPAVQTHQHIANIDSEPELCSLFVLMNTTRNN